MAAPGILASLAVTLRLRGVDAAYVRGDDRVDCLRFVRGTSKRTNTPEQGGVRTVIRIEDWIGRAEDLQLAGQQSEPQAGDQILLRLPNDQLQTYEVQPIAGEPCWRYLPETDDLWLRIHTQLIAQE